MQFLTEFASTFDNRDDYVQFLEGVALIAFKDALCNVDGHELNISVENQAGSAYGRAAAFLLLMELELNRRTNIAICGREIPSPV